MNNDEKKALMRLLKKTNNFVDGNIDANNFSLDYMRIFLKENIRLDDRLFDILNYLFTSCDAYCNDPKLRNHVIDAIDEDELLRDAKDALKKFDEWCRQNNFVF